MNKKVKPIPEGYSAVTPSLTVKGTAKALDFYKKAFGAAEIMRMPTPDGKIQHAEIKIGGSIIMIEDEFPEFGAQTSSPESLKGTTTCLYLYVEDVDKVFKRAKDAGAKIVTPVADMFWGDRYGQVQDPFGHQWGIATRTENLTPEEIGKRAKERFAQPAKV